MINWRHTFAVARLHGEEMEGRSLIVAGLSDGSVIVWQGFTTSAPRMLVHLRLHKVAVRNLCFAESAFVSVSTKMALTARKGGAKMHRFGPTGSRCELPPPPWASIAKQKH